MADEPVGMMVPFAAEWKIWRNTCLGMFQGFQKPFQFGEILSVKIIENVSNEFLESLKQKDPGFV